MLKDKYPGLTFEEYRDGCVFLSYYQYLYMKYKEELPEKHSMKFLASMVLRGKLQRENFCDIISEVDCVLDKLCIEVRLKELSFWECLQIETAKEKQKSLARFIRKRIKRLYTLEEESLLQYENYAMVFGDMIQQFANEEKGMEIPENLQMLYEAFCEEKSVKKIFQPKLQYGILLNNIIKRQKNCLFYGYESKKSYLDIAQIYAYMQGNLARTKLLEEQEWLKERDDEKMDSIIAYFPEGIHTSILSENKWDIIAGQEKKLDLSKHKEEFAFLFLMLSYLNGTGEMSIILPASLLYREGKEVSLRRYLIEEKNWLDMLVLLPKQEFDKASQEQVFLYLKKDRKEKNIMFIDASKSTLHKSEIEKIKEIQKNHLEVKHYSKWVDLQVLEENQFNLNFARYFSKQEEKKQVDLHIKKLQIQRIEEELFEIEKKIGMYRRDLSIR